MGEPHFARVAVREDSGIRFFKVNLTRYSDSELLLLKKAIDEEVDSRNINEPAWWMSLWSRWTGRTL